MEVGTLYEADLTLSLEGVIETLKTDAGLLLKNQTDLTAIQSTLDAEYERSGYQNMVHYRGAFDPQRVLPAVKRSIVFNEVCSSLSSINSGFLTCSTDYSRCAFSNLGPRLSHRLVRYNGCICRP